MSMVEVRVRHVQEDNVLFGVQNMKIMVFRLMWVLMCLNYSPVEIRI